MRITKSIPRDAPPPSSSHTDLVRPAWVISYLLYLTCAAHVAHTHTHMHTHTHTTQTILQHLNSKSSEARRGNDESARSTWRLFSDLIVRGKRVTTPTLRLRPQQMSSMCCGNFFNSDDILQDEQMRLFWFCHSVKEEEGLMHQGASIQQRWTPLVV